MRRRQDWMHTALGGWALLSPWILKLTAAHGAAAWGTSLAGAAVLALAAPRLLASNAWEDATTTLLGLALLASPWMLDFTGQTGPTAIVGGVLAMALVVSPRVSEPGRIRWRRRRRALLKQGTSSRAASSG